MAQKTKTRVVFVFGRHQNHAYGLNISADKKFFADAILPELNAVFNKTAQKAIVIHEAVIVPSRGIDDTEANMRVANMPKDAALVEISNQTKSTIVLIAAEYASMDCGVRTGGEEYDLGFENRLLEINGYLPRKIINLMEPQSTEAVYLALVAERYKLEVLRELNGQSAYKITKYIARKWAKYLRFVAESVIIRDRLVHSLIVSISEKEPETTFIVPRGITHKSMTDLFDAEQFSIYSKCQTMPPIAILDVVVILSSRTVSDQEIESIAFESLSSMLSDPRKFSESYGF